MSRPVLTIATVLIQPELLAEEVLARVGVARHFFRRALDQHLPVHDDVGAVADGERLAHVVVGNQNAEPAVAQAGEALPTHSYTEI